MNGRLFLLSPANCGGPRARQLLSPTACSPLATKLQSAEGAALGELFAFVSALYFRGKLAYARRFAQLPAARDPFLESGVHIITANMGLRAPEDMIGSADFETFAGVDIRADNPRFTEPLRQTARHLLAAAGPAADVILLGSVASPKYVDALVSVFGERLRFPVEFVGRGDMSRGGLLLRSAAAGVELTYVPVAGAIRHGHRPPKLVPLGRQARGGRFA